MSKYNTVEFATQVVNQYLYGQDSKPSDTDLFAGKYLSQSTQKTIDVDLSICRMLAGMWR